MMTLVRVSQVLIPQIWLLFPSSAGSLGLYSLPKAIQVGSTVLRGIELSTSDSVARYLSH